MYFENMGLHPDLKYNRMAHAENTAIYLQCVNRLNGKHAAVRTRTIDRRQLTASQLTARTTDRQKQLRALYRSENALRALNNLTRLENRLTAGSRFGQG